MASIGLDRERIRDLFDLRRREDGGRYVTYTQDLYPKFHELPCSGRRRRTCPVRTFANLLLLAGSGTTWKQMGITLLALLSTPGAMDAVREDRTLLRNAVEESLRWNVTDPMFSRWAAEDTTVAGVDIPAGAVVHACVGSANRDPLRWQEPDAFDIRRELKSSLCFASGPHVCLGQHVARAEMLTAIGALIDRLPNLRLDPEAESPGIIGLYERGPTHVPVLWG
jgi:cytochrome P450